MEIIKEIYHLLCINRCPDKSSSDIMEHLPTLYKYANECDSVFETGVRTCVSSWAFMCGLLDGATSNSRRKKIFMNDIDVCDVDLLVLLSKKLNIDVGYEWKSNLLLDMKNETYDITFIDTWHVYAQLKRELAKFAKHTNKYIIMHDTTIDELYGETIRMEWNAQQQSEMTGFPVDEIKKGLWPAISEFLENNPEWHLKERFTNCNGLTILARRSPISHPINFSIPEEKIADFTSVIKKKTKILSSLIPGDLTTYVYDNETDYYNEYQQSLFAITKRKGGWDCLRHYEIIANGCIPFFENFAQCPPNTMGLFPKKMIDEGNNFYLTIANKTRIDEISNVQIQEYEKLLTRMMNYLKEHLTTKKMAKYVLKMSKCENASKVLFLSGDMRPDYLRCLTLHGFKELLGDQCHDYPIVPHIYKNANIDYKSLYGKGITYTNLLDAALHNDAFDPNVENLIKTRFFDVIIYGSYHRGTPLFELVAQHYSSNEIIMLCGEDYHICNYEQIVQKGINVFVREL